MLPALPSSPMRRSHDIPSPARLGITVHRLAACSLQLFLLPAKLPTLVVIGVPRFGAFAVSASCPHRYYLQHTLYRLWVLGQCSFDLMQTAHTTLGRENDRAIHSWRESSPECGSPVKFVLNV
jgi:hypothetical protein